MTIEEISCYELAYQIRCFVGKSKMDDSQFAEVVSIPYEQISCFLAHQEPSLSVSQISKICDALYISMDSLVRGPVEERAFQDLIKRCAFAGKLNGTIFYNIYMFFLKRWREKNISGSCLERYTQWFLYFCSKQDVLAPSARNAIHGNLSAVCFTRKIAKKKAEKLKQLIEDSKKK